MNVSKCKIGQVEVTVLGHIFREGYTPSQENVEAVVKII